MEKTPFDPSSDAADSPASPPPLSPAPMSFDAFSGSVAPPTQVAPPVNGAPMNPTVPVNPAASGFVPPPLSPAPSIHPAPTIQFDAPAPIPGAPAPRKNNLALWAIPLALVVLAGSGIGWGVHQKQQVAAAREAKLAALRADLKQTALQDNALVLELLDEGALEHITYAEFFKRADKNKEARDELVRHLRATEAGPYGADVARYIELLEGENKWVRAEEAISNASLDAATKWDAYQRARGRTDELGGRVQSSYQAFLAAPYGSDFSERLEFQSARSTLKSASEEAQNSFAAWSQSQSQWSAKKRVTAGIINDWLRDEPGKYLPFAPKRDIKHWLVARQKQYAGAASSGAAATEGTATDGAPTEGAATAQVVPVEVATPEPKVPTRVHATKPLDGERFPQTRTDDLDETFASDLSDDDLRYALNEMFARYGLSFKNKSLQAQFEETTWYQPNPKWTPAQVKAAFSQRERDNFDILTTERDNRQNAVESNNSSDDSNADDNSSSDGNSTDDSGSNPGDTGGRTVESGE